MKETAQLLRENIPGIMELWQKRVKMEVRAARLANPIALFDHLPNIILDIAEIMERAPDMGQLARDRVYLQLLDHSTHHGRHRATTSNYTVEQVVHEYFIFRDTLEGFIVSHHGHDTKGSQILRDVIEASILRSVGAFTAALQQMQEKLIGTLAHDIRNPLSAAKLSLDIMDRDPGGHWGTRGRESAGRSLDRAIQLIEGLMDGITVRAGEGMMLDFRETDIAEDVRWVYRESTQVYGNEIELDCPPGEIRGVFDTVAIRRLLENLIGNAVKYGSPKTPIRVCVIDEPCSVQLRVHNHGDPIPPGKRESIFGFLEGAKNGKGMVEGSWGMGLTLARIVAEAHGGDIDLISEQGSGTTFTINLIKDFNEPGRRRAKLALIPTGIASEGH